MSTSGMVATLAGIPASPGAVFNVRVRRLLYAAGWAVLTVLAGGAVWWGLSPLLSSSGPWFARPDPPVSSATAPGTTPPPGSTSPAVAPKTTAAKPPVTSSPAPASSSYDGWAFSNGVFTRSFDMLGGTATMRIVNGHVELVEKSARGGYLSTVEQPQPERLVVRFYKPGGPASIIDAMWRDGSYPFAELSEIQ
jgi:hypothetical protein